MRRLPPLPRGLDAFSMKVLETIRHHGPVSKVGIGREMGLVSRTRPVMGGGNWQPLTYRKVNRVIANLRDIKLIAIGGHRYRLSGRGQDWLHAMAHAQDFATQQHQGQLYGDSKEPYIVHVAEVYAVAIEVGVVDLDVLVATWLHDVMEDCGVSKETLSTRFGRTITELVWTVSNAQHTNEHFSGSEPPGEPLSTRRERNPYTYGKIAPNPSARILKLANRLANVRRRGKLFDMYRKEYPLFRSSLRPDDPRGPELELWTQLDAALLPPETPSE